MKQFYSDAEISVDTVHANDVPFLTSIIHDVHHGIVVKVEKLKFPALEYGIQKVIRSYSVRVFNIVLISVDIKSKSLKDRDEAGVKFNVVSKEEHALNIER